MSWGLNWLISLKSLIAPSFVIYFFLAVYVWKKLCFLPAESLSLDFAGRIHMSWHVLLSSISCKLVIGYRSLVRFRFIIFSWHFCFIRSGIHFHQKWCYQPLNIVNNWSINLFPCIFNGIVSNTDMLICPKLNLRSLLPSHVFLICWQNQKAGGQTHCLSTSPLSIARISVLSHSPYVGLLFSKPVYFPKDTGAVDLQWRFDLPLPALKTLGSP